LSLMDGQNTACPIRRQAIPSIEELAGTGRVDPLNERSDSHTPAFIKRYPGRGVFLVTSQCAMYCRFCNRKRLAGLQWDPGSFREETLTYLEKEKDVREIILSGGDPFVLPPEELGYLLARLRRMNHVKTIRISTRMPVVHPEGLFQGHFAALEKAAPAWVVIHINHPREVSPEFVHTVKALRRAGSILVSQTVLLRNVNDCPHVLAQLFGALVECGIKPYYLFQLDEVRGGMHFKVRLERGIEIMRHLRNRISGLAMPQYVLDVTGGLGKAPVDYRYVKGWKGGNVQVESSLGKIGRYRDDGRESRCMGCGLCRGMTDEAPLLARPL
jgi:lysine 2,3-aminomutase